MAEAKDNKWTRAPHNEGAVAPQAEIFWCETKAAACKPESSVFHGSMLSFHHSHFQMQTLYLRNVSSGGT